ncbi:MAG: LytTR family DNA-binding domain-containing protein [Bacteroidia bacterium]
MEFTPILENHERSIPPDQVLTFLQSNHHIFQSSPELLQRVLRFLQTFLPVGKSEKERILLPQTNGFLLVDEKEILYLKAEGSYTYVTLHNGQKLLISRSLKDFVMVLSDEWFERIHKSYIINLRYLKGYSRLQGGTAIMEDGTELLISRRRLTIFLQKMAKIAMSLE